MLPDLSKLQLAFAVVTAFVTGNHLWGVDEEQPVAPPPAIPNCHVISTGLNADEKAALLRQHNELRSMVAKGQLKGLEPAANMLALRWDDDLAELAQAQAKQCSFSPEVDEEEKTIKPPSVGQNVGWEASSDPFSDHLDLPHLSAWMDQHTDVEDDVISSYRNTERGIGQFTQAPKDEERRLLWERNLHRLDKPLDADCAVCEFHFEPHFIARDYVHVINGVQVQISRGTPTLASDAVPTILPNPPAYLTPAPRTRKKRRHQCVPAENDNRKPRRISTPAQLLVDTNGATSADGDEADEASSSPSSDTGCHSQRPSWSCPTIKVMGAA
ncbi:hypothetical protein HPB51_013463 [Rhipicephalus microplus]|uniref:THAP-type domain-containing protein n=1 Tax=Rhipicephalus microplus TaxID=6941 RepID=A0A9J6DVW3_RHIMP|nr:hypothetical protein HPB51_013463 [Rhipicephalus microplus]